MVMGEGDLGAAHLDLLYLAVIDWTLAVFFSLAEHHTEMVEMLSPFWEVLMTSKISEPGKKGL